MPPEPKAKADRITAIEKAALKEQAKDGLAHESTDLDYSPEKPLQMHALENDFPFAAELLDFTGEYEYGDVDRVNIIDQYIRAELDHRGLKPLLQPYKEVFDRISSELGINSYMDRDVAVEKMYVYLKKAVEDRKLFLKIGIKYGEKPTLKDLSVEELKTLLK